MSPQCLALGHSLIDARLANITNGHGRAFHGKFDGGGQADALGSARDDADLAGQSLCGEGVHGVEMSMANGVKALVCTKVQSGTQMAAQYRHSESLFTCSNALE